MARDESTGSLADQAAAWVPPWSRRPEPAEVAEEAEVAEQPEPAEPTAIAAEPAEPGAEAVELAVAVEPPVESAAVESAEPATVEPVESAVVAESVERAAAEPGEPRELEAVVEATERVGVAELGGSMEPAAGAEPAAPAAVVAEPPEPLEPLPPAEPLEPLPPIEPAVPAEPAEPIGPEEPAEPMVPVEPLPPVEPAEPLEPLEPFEPTDPLEPGDPLATNADGSAAPDVAQTSSHQSSQLAAIATTELKGALEAILLVVDEPVSEIMLAQIIEQPTDRISATLAELAAEYDEQERGFELRAVAGGWRFYTRTAYAAYVERFVLDGQQVRLTQAALETLAVIAYKQPVTRSRISAIRGVNCDGVVRTLLSRGLVEECGSEPDSGAYLYRTTTLFLEKLGLNSVDQLPALAPFLPDDVEAIADAAG